MQKLGFILLCGVSLALLLPGCGTKGQKDEGPGTTAAETFAVAVINDYPPFEYEKDGKLTGFDVDLMQDIAKREHFTVKWQVMKFNGIIPALQADQVDAAISAIDINDERKLVVNFSPSYFESGNYLFVKEDSPIHSYADLKGRSIAALQASVGLKIVQDLANKNGGKVSIVPDIASLFMAVESGQANALIEDSGGVDYKMKADGEKVRYRKVGDVLKEHHYGIAVTKKNTALLQKISDGLKQAQDDGTYKKLHDQYFAASN